MLIIYFFWRVCVYSCVELWVGDMLTVVARTLKREECQTETVKAVVLGKFRFKLWQKSGSQLCDLESPRSYCSVIWDFTVVVNVFPPKKKINNNK